MTGEIYNTIVEVDEVTEETEHNLFNIEWNNTENKVNQKTSVAVNTRKYVRLKTKPQEIYHPGDFYQIEAGKYHISRTDNDHPINSTLFLFNTQKSRVKNSYVVGPSTIDKSEVNRKVNINPKPLLNKLGKILNNGR